MSQDLNTVFTKKDYLFGSVKLTKDVDLYIYIYIYSSCGIGADSCSEFSLTDSGVGENVIILGVDTRSYLHIDNKNKGILVLGKEPPQGLEKNYIDSKQQSFLLIFQDPNKKLL